MIKDYSAAIAEMLFWLTGGELLLNTVWIFVWVVSWSIAITSPMFYLQDKSVKWTIRLVVLLMFFPGILFAIGPALIQVQMMTECLPAENHSVTLEPGVDIEIRVQQCRLKENFYGEFGEWQFRLVDKNL